MTEPVTPGAAFGLFFIYPGGYYVSCGEGTIGAATVAIETGMVARQGEDTRIVIDTEAGAVETIARSEGDRVARGHAALDAVVRGAAPASASRSRAWARWRSTSRSASATSSPSSRRQQVGVAVRREHVKKIAQRGMAVRDAVNAQLRVDVPGLGKTSVDNVLIHELPDAGGRVAERARVGSGPGRRCALRLGHLCARWRSFTTAA